MTIPKNNDLYGLVLAGGQSSRMGVDKSHLDFHGIPQKDYVFHLLESHCKEVHTSISSDVHGGTFTNALLDQFPFRSPLNGILTAFHNHPNAAWLTLPIDMPFVNEQTLRVLIENRNKNKVATCFYDVEEKFPEPLLTIWEPKARVPLLEFHENGKKSPREFLISSDVNLIKAPDKNWLISVNTPEEFARIRGQMPK